MNVLRKLLKTNPDYRSLRRVHIWQLLPIAFFVMLFSLTTHAQTSRQRPPDLTLNQVIEFCDPQINAYHVQRIGWFLGEAARNRVLAEQGGPNSVKWDHVRGYEADAEDLRSQGYQSKHSVASPQQLKSLNDDSAAHIRAVMGYSLDDLKSDDAAKRTFRAADLCMLGLRLAQFEGKPLAQGRYGNGVSYQPPRRTASSAQADDPKALGSSYRP